MNRKRRRKRTHKNVTINYYYINVSSSDKKADKKDKILTLINFVSAILTIIAAIIALLW